MRIRNNDIPRGKHIYFIIYTLFKYENKKEFIGILKEYNDDFLVLKYDDEDLKIETDKISSAKSVYDWNE